MNTMCGCFQTVGGDTEIMINKNKIISMQNAIIDYIRSQMPQDKNRAHIGTVHKGQVVIDNESFPYIPTVDLYFGDGSQVACIRPENSNTAVIVGVL